MAYTPGDETQDYFPSSTAGGNEAGQGRAHIMCEVTDESVAELWEVIWLLSISVCLVSCLPSLALCKYLSVLLDWGLDAFRFVLKAVVYFKALSTANLQVCSWDLLWKALPYGKGFCTSGDNERPSGPTFWKMLLGTEERSRSLVHQHG